MLCQGKVCSQSQDPEAVNAGRESFVTGSLARVRSSSPGLESLNAARRSGSRGPRVGVGPLPTSTGHRATLNYVITMSCVLANSERHVRRLVLCHSAVEKES